MIKRYIEFLEGFGKSDKKHGYYYLVLNISDLNCDVEFYRMCMIDKIEKLENLFKNDIAKMTKYDILYERCMKDILKYIVYVSKKENFNISEFYVQLLPLYVVFSGDRGELLKISEFYGGNGHDIEEHSYENGESNAITLPVVVVRDENIEEQIELIPISKIDHYSKNFKWGNF